MSDHLIERERRWIVRDYDPKVLIDRKQCQITQGYFEVLGERSCRIRLIRDSEGERAVVTVKEGTGEIRTEREEPEKLVNARLMLEVTSYRVEKRRYFIEGWELDIFEGPLAGIVVLEYEAKGDEPIPPLPEWIHDAIDVTDSLTNLHLARMAKEISGDVNEHVSRYLEPKLPKIVLTGGPCSGKSTLMREVIEKYGDRVHCVPEVATILIAQVGIRPDAKDEAHSARFQKILYRVQRSFEEAAELQAMKDGKKAIILDRGTADAIAYQSGVHDFDRVAQFEQMTGMSASHERKRYSCVLWLAPPSLAVYNKYCLNNPARKETYQKAFELGSSARMAWWSRADPQWSFNFLREIDGQTWETKRAAAFKVLDTLLSP